MRFPREAHLSWSKEQLQTRCRDKNKKTKKKNDILTLIYCFSFLKEKIKAFYHIPFLIKNNIFMNLIEN
jgi:hypothetical protein